MATMSLVVEPLKREDLDQYIRIWWDAFEEPSAKMIFPLVYPRGFQPDLLERFRYRLLKRTDGDLGSYCFVAKDGSSGEIVGVSKWETVQHPPQTREEMEKEVEDAVQGRDDEPTVAGMNEELNRALARALVRCAWETLPGKPHVNFQVLAVHPKHQRRGVGALLLRSCLEKADSLHLPVYLESGVPGRRLYERFGFEVVRDFPLNVSDYGKLSFPVLGFYTVVNRDSC